MLLSFEDAYKQNKKFVNFNKKILSLIAIEITI